jgi:DNA-binding HxlR family transcriptional regulator
MSSKSLCAATAAYFSSRGYFVRRNYEVTGIKTVDIVCIMPRLSDLKKRIKSKYFIPSGILYTLIDQDWKSSEDISAETDSSPLFVSSALEDLSKDGWVDKKEEKSGSVLWKLREYSIPSKDCVMAHCRYRECMEFLEGLSELDGCYNKMYVVFPYPIDEEFMDLCSQKGVGILIFYEKVGFFKEQLPPESKTVTNLKVYANLCEVIIKENLLYRSIDSI